MIFQINGSLDLGRVLCGGQTFRWIPCEDGFMGASGDRCAFAAVRNGNLIIDGDGSETYWIHYFALDRDYPALQAELSADPVMKSCVEYAPGIRVLRQDFFETLISFILSSCNNIPRITGIVRRLCELTGNPIGHGLYSFPSPEVLASLTEKDLEPLRAGYRVPYILQSAGIVAESGWTGESLSALPLSECEKKLCTLPGVGKKVADCVMLFSLGFEDAFPVDVHIGRAMERLFPAGLPECAMGVKGIAQQYIFEYARHELCSQS